MFRYVLTLTLLLQPLLTASSALASVGIDLSRQSSRETFRVEALIMEKNRDCTKMVIAEEPVRIGRYNKQGGAGKTHLLDTWGKAMRSCTFKQGERVILDGVVLKDGTVMAYSIQKTRTDKP